MHCKTEVSKLNEGYLFDLEDEGTMHEDMSVCSKASLKEKDQRFNFNSEGINIVEVISTPEMTY